MPKHTFTETTEVNNKVFFEGEAELSDADLKAVKEMQGSNAEINSSTGTSAFPEDYPGFDVLGAVEGMTPEKLAGMSDEDILKIDGIGPATLKQIRSYEK